MRALASTLVIMVIFSSSVTADDHRQLPTPEPPEGDWHVLDLAGVISNETEAIFENELARASEESGVLIRLVTIKSMKEAGNMSCSKEDLAMLGFPTALIDDALANDDWFENWFVYENCNGISDYFFSEDTGYARQMFRHFGMEGGEQPGMLIALSTHDRQFKFVMPELSVTSQRISQTVFDAGSHELTVAADTYLDPWWPGTDFWETEDTCIWEGNQEWVMEYGSNDMWHCGWDFGSDGDVDEWNNWWYLCERNDGQWWCTDEYGQDPSHKNSENGSLMPELPSEPEEYLEGNLWEEALSYYVFESKSIVSSKPWPLPVHLMVYVLGAFGMSTLVRSFRKEYEQDEMAYERFELAEQRIRYAYAWRRADLSLKAMKGDEEGTVFEQVSDQIESLTRELRKDPRGAIELLLSGEVDDYYGVEGYLSERELEKTCVELNKRADDAGVQKEIAFIDMDMGWEIDQIRALGEQRDRLNKIAIPCGSLAFLSFAYLGFSLLAGGPLSLGRWVIENPWTLTDYPVYGTWGALVIVSSVLAFYGLLTVVMAKDELVNAIAPPRSALFPLYRPRPKMGSLDRHNIVIPSFLAGSMVSSSYFATSAGFDEHGNELYETERVSSGGGGDSGGGCGGGCGGGGCGGGGCGGGGGF